MHVHVLGKNVFLIMTFIIMSLLLFSMFRNIFAFYASEHFKNKNIIKLKTHLTLKFKLVI